MSATVTDITEINASLNELVDASIQNALSDEQYKEAATASKTYLLARLNRELDDAAGAHLAYTNQVKQIVLSSRIVTPNLARACVMQQQRMQHLTWLIDMVTTGELVEREDYDDDLPF